METSLTAPVRGRVREVLVSANAHVPAGRPLLQIDPLEDAPSGARGRARALRARGRRRRDRARSGWRGSCSATTSRPTRSSACSPGAPVDPDGERRLLEVYADVRALNRPHAEASTARRARQPAGAPARLPALARPAGRGPARALRGHLERALAPLRRRRAGAHRRARGRRLPAVPLPAARADRARGACAPCSPATWSAASWPARPTTRSAPCSTGSRWRSRRASPRWPSWRASCAGATSTSPRSRPPARTPTPRWPAHLAALAEGRPGRARGAPGGARRLPAAARRRC